MSGYLPCACRDCFETAIGEPPCLCWECEEAGCDVNGEHECAADHELLWGENEP